MTGLECFQEELMKRGYTRQQATSKTAIAVLDLVAQTGGKYAQQERLMWEIKQLEHTIQGKKDEIEQFKRSADREIERVRKVYVEAQNYISKWNEALMQCETPELRDAMRTAQVFINTADVDTKYDNTAFIIGLAAILSNGNIGPISELKKINPRIPQPVLCNGFYDTQVGLTKDDDARLI